MSPTTLLEAQIYWLNLGIMWVIIYELLRSAISLHLLNVRTQELGRKLRQCLPKEQNIWAVQGPWIIHKLFKVEFCHFSKSRLDLSHTAVWIRKRYGRLHCITIFINKKHVYEDSKCVKEHMKWSCWHKEPINIVSKAQKLAWSKIKIIETISVCFKASHFTC